MTESSTTAASTRSARPQKTASGLLLMVTHLAWGVVVLWLLLNVVINVMLSTKLVHVLASSSPDSVMVDYRNGWSIWPGPVHVNGVHIRGQDENVQWVLDVEHADANILLTDLPHLFFHCSKVIAHGASFRLRQRLDKSANDPVFIAALPPIDDLPSPPRVPDVRTPAPTPEQLKTTWRVEIDDAEVDHLAEVWVDDVRVDGEGTVAGGFRLKPGSSLAVGPAHTEVLSADIHAGEYTLVDSLAGTIDSSLEPMELALVPGGNILNYLALDAHLKGKIPNVASFDYYGRGIAVRASGGAGTLTADLKIDRGVLEPPSRLAIDCTGVQTNIGPVVSTFALHAAIEADAGDHALHLRAHADDMTVQSTTAIVWARVPELLFDLSAGSLDLELVGKHPAFAVDAPEIDLPHLETLGALWKPGDVSINSGNAKGKLHFEYETNDQRGRGELSMRGPLDLTYKGTNVTAGLAFDAKVPSYDLAAGEADISGSRIEIRDVRVGGNANRTWWGRAEMDKGHVGWKGDPAVQFHAIAQAADARPVLLFLKDQDEIPGWVTAVVSLNHVTAQSNVSFAGSGIDVEQLTVDGSDLKLHGALHTHGAASKSCFLVQSGPLSIGLDGRSSKTSFILLGAEDWFNHATPCR